MMFSKPSTENIHNINSASDGSIAATNINAPVVVQNIVQNMPQNQRDKGEILKVLYSSTPEEWSYNDDTGIYIFVKDIYLQICEIRQDELVPFNEPWVRVFEDPNAYRIMFLLKYNEIEIRRLFFACVDGARVFIPYPKSCSDLRITKEQYHLGRIINHPFASCYSFDEYLRRAKIAVDMNSGEPKL